MIDWIRGLYLRLPAGAQGSVLVMRRSRLWKQAGIVFIHVPKAAGTSISTALYGRFIGHARARDIQRWAFADVRALPSFAVTRNPWDRLVSAYRYGRRLHTHDWKVNRAAPTVVRQQVPQHDDFATFVTEWLQHRDVTRLNQIYQPQHMYICDKHGRPLVDHVGRVENLGPTVEFIQQHCGPLPALGAANPSGEKVDYRTFYTSRLVDIVARIYARDVETFGYSFDEA